MSEREVINLKNPAYKLLGEKVVAMYSYAANEQMIMDKGVVTPIKPEDFTWELELDLNIN